MTLQTIADMVGVSRMTVSNAFSRPNQLSSDLRDRILAAADELGYVGPDPSGRALARGTTGAVGVLLTDSLRDAFTNEVAAEFLGAIAAELAPTGLALTLLTSSAATDAVPARDVPLDGALVYSCDETSTAVAWLERRRLPLVFVDQDSKPGVPSVNIDDRAGARAAAQHLIDLGHRRIGIADSTVSGEAGLVDDPRAAVASHVHRQRMLGWLDALDAAHITPVVAQGLHSDVDKGEEPARLLLDRPAGERPTGIVCISDVVAYGVVQVARRLGLRVPDDVSVVGFDDSPLASRMEPALTTVHQDVAAKGRAAATALTRAIEQSQGDAKPRARHELLPTTLIVRASTGPAPL